MQVRQQFESVEVIDTPTADRLTAKSAWFSQYGWQPFREQLATKRWARILTPQLERLQPDWVLSINASHKVVDLPSKWRVAHFSDGLFGPMATYYEKYRVLGKRTLRLGDALERRLLQRGGPILLSSNWAVEQAAAYYGEPPSRFDLAPMGANLLVPPPAAAPWFERPAPRLLFVGYAWERKGGPRVLEVFERLRQLCPESELHVVGCNPRAARGRKGVIVHGLLAKENPDENARLKALFAQSDFFVMLSRQEAYGLVYCEAAAFGLPAIASDTGGIPDIVRDGVSGLIFDNAIDPGDIAAGMFRLWQDRERYLDMRKGARAEYETRLSWNAWGRTLRAALEPAAELHPAV